MLLSQFPPVQPASAKERKIHLEEAGSFTSLKPKKEDETIGPSNMADADIAENSSDFSHLLLFTWSSDS